MVKNLAIVVLLAVAAIVGSSIVSDFSKVANGNAKALNSALKK